MDSLVKLIALCMVITIVVSDESNLVLKLLEKYHRDARPRNETVHVSCSFYFAKLQEVDERAQVMKITGGASITWKDPRLVWDIDEYPGTELLVFHQTEIWTPEIIIYNSVVDIHESLRGDDTRIRVTNTGDVEYQPLGVFEVICILDVTFFPLDKQACYVDLTSMQYTNTMVKLNDAGPLFFNSTHSQWSIHSVEVIETGFNDSIGSYDSLYYIVHLERKPLYYVKTMIIPLLIMSVLILVMFHLPADSGEKVSLGITLLLTFSVFQILLSDNMPRTSDQTAILEGYIEFVLVLTTLSVILTVVVLNIHHKDDCKAVPKWLYSFTFCFLARMLCMETHQKKSGRTIIDENKAQVANEESGEADNLEAKPGWRDVARVWDRFFFMITTLSLLIISVALVLVYILQDPKSVEPIII